MPSDAPNTPDQPAVRPLPPVAAQVDRALARIDREVDWLSALSPVGNDAMWHAFAASGFSAAPTLRYPEQRCDLSALRDELRALPVDDIEEPAFEALLREKQREVDRQIELVTLRDTDGFVAASIDLFGDADPDLIRTAQGILDTVEAEFEAEGEETATADDLVRAAEAEMDRYREVDPRFAARIVLRDDLNSGLMVSDGNLHVARSYRARPAAIRPMIAHEVGTHVLTAHNGRCQPLAQLAVGLADYDPLQEGLGTFSEYLTGYLPPRRLRVLAARVVAADLAICGEGLQAIFERLFEGEGLSAEDAFDTAVRAKRGGGLTKDAVYLRGLRGLLAYLATGGDFEFLLLGKLAMRQRHPVRRLLDEGWLIPPTLLPSHLSDPAAQRRLARARRLDVGQLYQTEPPLEAPQEGPTS